MWTFNNFPSDKVAAKYGFKPDAAWLDKVRLGSARLAQGCSASFVSPDGLVMTKHTAAHSCIAQLSTKSKDFVKSGFTAKDLKSEVKCPDLEVNQLIAISDVTKRRTTPPPARRVRRTSRPRRPRRRRSPKNAPPATKSAATSVTLYKGGKYDSTNTSATKMQDWCSPRARHRLLRWRPRQLQLSRYDLDVSFVRVYENGKPAATTNYFPVSQRRRPRRAISPSSRAILATPAVSTPSLSSPSNATSSSRRDCCASPRCAAS